MVVVLVVVAVVLPAFARVQSLWNERLSPTMLAPKLLRIVVAAVVVVAVAPQPMIRHHPFSLQVIQARMKRLMLSLSLELAFSATQPATEPTLVLPVVVAAADTWDSVSRRHCFEKRQYSQRHCVSLVRPVCRFYHMACSLPTTVAATTWLALADERFECVVVPDAEMSLAVTSHVPPTHPPLHLLCRSSCVPSGGQGTS